MAPLVNELSRLVAREVVPVVGRDVVESEHRVAMLQATQPSCSY